MEYWVDAWRLSLQEGHNKEDSMTQADEDLRLYIIMRTDMASLHSSGKATPQAAHAQSEATTFHMGGSASPAQRDAYARWQAQSSFSFGSTIVKGASLQVIETTLEALQAMDVPSGIVVDETYPLRDGEVTHLLNLPTCAWCFGDKTLLQPLLGHIPLL
jgi:peptidyl-tRNA hydrolase